MGRAYVDKRWKRVTASCTSVALLARRADYWKSNAAWFDEVEILAIDDVAAGQVPDDAVAGFGGW